MRVKQTYREQLMLFLAILAFIAVLGYQKSIKGSIEIYSECERLEKEITKTENLIEQLPLLQLRAQETKNTLKDQVDSENSIQQSILSVISQSVLDKQIHLEAFDALHHYSENNYIIQTQRFILKGDFIHTLQLVDKIENTFDLSKISSLDYYTKQNFNSGKKELYAKVYLQKVTRN